MFWSVLTATCCFSEKKLEVLWSSLGLIVCIVIVKGYQPWNTANTTADIYLLVENSYKNIATKCKVCSNILINHLAALRPTLGLWHGGNLSHHMLITTLFQVRPKVRWDPCIEVGFQSLTKRISGIWAGYLPILSLMCYPTVPLSPKVY